MGTEALVEVHTPNELELALSLGATMFLVNMWDRAAGVLYPDQARGLIALMPINAVAVAAGGIRSMQQVLELGHMGYNGVVVGRHLQDVGDLRAFARQVHDFRGPPHGPKAGLMKGLPVS